MQWQDWVLSVGGFVILLSLIPTIRGESKPALTTCVMTSVLVGVFTVTMATLGLWLASVANGLIAIAWGVIAVQCYKQVERKKHISVLAQIEQEVEASLHAEPDTTIEAQETEPQRV